MLHRSILIERARQLRRNPTRSEAILWDELKGKKLGVRFRRQHPLGKYIFDFYCHSAKLAIELDGNYHNRNHQKLLDVERERDIISWGIKVIRFPDEEINTNLEGAIEKIRAEINM
ncbi:MAG: DUF559 domain-containing protein [Saprospiraceae bacterium]|nr:DUF559 domain-containing protein [Saprospiraceae bacterium]